MNLRAWTMSQLCLLAVGLACFAQQKDVPQQETQSPRILTIADADDWQSVAQFVMSPDGQWYGHVTMPAEGDGQLIISRSTEGVAGDDGGAAGANAKTESKESSAEEPQSTEAAEPLNRYTFVAGPGSGRIKFSHDSNFAAWMQAPLDKAAKAAKKPDSAPKNKAMLLNLGTGEKIEFDSVQSFGFSGENPRCLVIHKMKPKGRPSGDGDWNGTDLLIHDLQTGSQINVGNVKSYAFNKSGDLLAMVIDAQGKSGNGLQLFHVEDSRIEILDSGKSTYGSMSWTRDGDALALLKAHADEEFDNDHRHLLAFSDVGTSRQKMVSLDPKTEPSIPDDMTISSNFTPEWNDERSAVFFGIEKLKKKNNQTAENNAAEKPEEKSANEKDAGLVVWHWKDPRLQSMQQKQESRDKSKFDLCVHHVGNGKTYRLGDEEIPLVSVSRPFKFAVGRDMQKYELSGNLDGRRMMDIYTIDLANGKRKLVLEAARYVFDVGPDGESLLYYKNEGHFFVYNMADGTHTNITQNVAVSFVDEEDDHNVVNPPRRPVGWSADGNHVLLSDGWDIWQVAIDGSGAENLTVNGKTEQIRYTNPHRFDREVDGIDLSGPIYFSAYGEWTKKAGFARWNPGAMGVEMLVWEDASFGQLSKLEDHDVYSYTRSTRMDPPSYHMAGPDLNRPTQLTDLSEQREKFHWSSGVKLVNYTNAEGVKLQGALHLPANYIEGKKYPTIVYMYEKLSQTANRFDSPRAGGFSAAIYTSNGYAVFNPDIVFQINDPGVSSQDCILAGLDAAIESGVVDPERVGLHGHSWGGYQTAFLITQTDRFRAAVAGAPLTNLISMYSSIYWNSGSANQPIFESSQGRFEGGYWDNLDAYARNSPVYFADQVTTPLLLLHNDEDGAVDWNQGIEYFNTLRRLGKPVVMLQYVGENHGLRKPENRKDYSYRMLDFFNHHLKGETPPTWWTDGIKHLDMKDHIKDYRKKNTTPAEK